MTDLSAHTTFRVGGPAGEFVQADTEQELIEAVRDADESGLPVLVLSGGSNMLVGDGGFDGRVVKVAVKGVQAEDVMSCSGAFLNVAAGEVWDDFVAYCVAQADRRQGFVGVEALSGIPGLVGATPVQNVGAYGQEVADTVARVRTWDRRAKQVKTFTAPECFFGYRTSVFKRTPMVPGAPSGRYVVLTVSFQLALGKLSAPIRYQELADKLGVATGQRAPLAEVRQAVLDLRRAKGMLLDPADHDTWSAGSFFTNPVLTPEQAQTLPDDAPRYPTPEGRVKTSAAWLIERAGFGKGYGDGPARLSAKHVLAVTNTGGAKASDVAELARQIIGGVECRFGVTLVPEPVLVGVDI
ncbi:MAG: UDP-N-acetylmuramate dehydrogenase, partial [Propionibacteriaceae bacterium]|nr:UDP-N-acetylmuramate dehydrogenase [Propionibacteriaceae bacterium]